ncbi:hypothetical protein [Paracoccus mutanolyticus]|uniref:hypothetical protein n=1 Tax=Paracoccus mutanolyticus TaxID=1499308 RepID=UPI0011AE2105|nr:hypothetical protein [Paracoccus mutanolyticus]
MTPNRTRDGYHRRQRVPQGWRRKTVAEAAGALVADEIGARTSSIEARVIRDVHRVDRAVQDRHQPDQQQRHQHDDRHDPLRLVPATVVQPLTVKLLDRSPASCRSRLE